MLRVEMLPAAHGDALWIEYGSENEVNRVLVDAGPAHAYEELRWKIAGLSPKERHFELLVITHVDADHIEGVIKLLQDSSLGCTFGNIWFNDWLQIEKPPGRAPLKPILGPMQGEFLGALIDDCPGQEWNMPWSKSLIYVPDTGELPTHTLDGGLKLTVLSPGIEEVDALRKEWDKVVKAAGFQPGNREQAKKQLRKQRRLGPPKKKLGGRGRLKDEDNSVANGSSIAVIAEFDGRAILLAGDAYAGRLRKSLVRWCGKDKPRSAKLDAFKLPHHGSSANVNPELVELLNCRNYLVSTNGAIFDHPDKAAIDCIISHHKARGKPRFHFNYRSAENDWWADRQRQLDLDYEAFYPEGNSIEFYAK